MKDLIVHNVNVTKILQKEYAGIDGDKIILLKIPVEQSARVNLEMARVLLSDGYAGIFITLLKSSDEFIASMSAEDTLLKKIIYIDAVSRMYGSTQPSQPNQVYVDGPLSLEAILEETIKILATVKQPKRFVLLDSTSLLIMYNGIAKAKKFTKDLIDTLMRTAVLAVITSESFIDAGKELQDYIETESGRVVDLTALKK